MSDGNIGSKTIMVVFNPLWTFDLKQQIAVAIEESSLGWSVQYLSNLNCQTTNIWQQIFIWVIYKHRFQQTGHDEQMMQSSTVLFSMLDPPEVVWPLYIFLKLAPNTQIIL